MSHFATPCRLTVGGRATIDNASTRAPPHAAHLLSTAAVAEAAIVLSTAVPSDSALVRWYVLHVMAMPLVMAVLMAMHFWRIRKDGGISGPL
jgi:hypothetical protein